MGEGKWEQLLYLCLKKALKKENRTFACERRLFAFITGVKCTEKKKNRGRSATEERKKI